MARSLSSAFVPIVLTLAFSTGCKWQSDDPSQVAKSEAALARLVHKRQTRRAYEGAPPATPHQVRELGREDCLSCHGMGDALDGTKRSKITPHPEFLNCEQCHVVQQVQGQFVATSFVGARSQPAPEPLHPLGPHHIPHRLQDRQKCEVCHLGPAAKPELVPVHGPRTNCQQCHLQLQSVEPFVATAQNTP